MSLYGALFSGVSGLSAQSSAMSAIADNVTNVNTVGYKSTQVQFQTLVTKQVSQTKYAAGGVQSTPRTGVDVQGLLQATSSATDVAISGQGFFVVNEQPVPGSGSLFAYTRAGSFKVDKDGYLQNTSGWYLQGWPLQPAGNSTTGYTTVTEGDDTFIKAYNDTNGDTVAINDNIVSKTDLQPLNLNTIGGTAQETKNINLGANLPSGDDIGEQHKANVVVYDTLGTSSNLEMLFTKDRENAWGMSVDAPSGSATIELHGSDSTDSTPDVFHAAGLIEMTSLPSDGDSIVIDGITFEFDTNGSVVETSTLRQVDISGATVTEASDVIPILKTAIDGSNLKEHSRFVSDGANLKITQSTMGAAISVDVSNTLSVRQIAANSNTGAFTIPEIDYAYKNGARFDFVSTTMTDYDGTQFTLGGVTFELNDTDNADAAVGAGTVVNYASSTASIEDVVTALNTAIAASSVSGTGRFSADGTSLVFEQSSTGGSMAMTLNATGGDGGAGTVTGVYKDDTNVTSASVVDSTAFTVVATSYGAKKAAIDFNGDGTPATINVDNVDVQWSNGASDQEYTSGTADTRIGLFLGNTNIPDGMTQGDGSYQINYISQNGAQFGNFAGISIGDDGLVTALFDNGVTRPVFMIPVATFVNPNKLSSLTGNVYIETDFSGQPTVREAGEGGAGSVTGASLEASTVDLGEEFTSMITTQRAYSAAAKIITTADQMLEELMSVKR